MSEPKKTIVINPDFLKLPMKGNKTKKNKDSSVQKPIKIRSEKQYSDKTIKRRALNYIRKKQEDRYKRLINGLDTPNNEPVAEKTYTDEFKNDFDDSLAFLQKLTDQNIQKAQVHNATLKHYPSPPIVPNSTLFQSSILDKVLDENVRLDEYNDAVDSSRIQPQSSLVRNRNHMHFPKPTYGCLKGGRLPTYRTLKTYPTISGTSQSLSQEPLVQNNFSVPLTQYNSMPQRQHNSMPQRQRLTPEQQRAELKQFLEKRKDEKSRIERVKRQQNILAPSKKQKRTITRTFRVGKSKHYARVGVLIPNKTIRTQVLAKKQKLREIPLEDIRRYLIKKGLIRVGSSCPNDVLRKMYESSMLMCGEIQNHNPDNLLYNYLHNGL
jgi:hypothetical protein